jgi:hypothetical protein
MVVRRSWTNAEAVGAMREFFDHPERKRAAVRALMTELLSPDRFDRRCAADVARRISAREPGVLGKYEGVLIDLLTELPLDEWQARGYLILAAALNARTHKQCEELAVLVRALAVDERNALRAIALEAFAILAVAEPGMRDEVTALLEHSRREGTCAMRSRARRMLPMVLKAEVEARSMHPSRR